MLRLTHCTGLHTRILCAGVQRFHTGSIVLAAESQTSSAANWHIFRQASSELIDCSYGRGYILYMLCTSPSGLRQCACCLGLFFFSFPCNSKQNSLSCSRMLKNINFIWICTFYFIGLFFLHFLPSTSPKSFQGFIFVCTGNTD